MTSDDLKTLEKAMKVAKRVTSSCTLAFTREVGDRLVSIPLNGAFSPEEARTMESLWNTLQDVGRQLLLSNVITGKQFLDPLPESVTSRDMLYRLNYFFFSNRQSIIDGVLSSPDGRAVSERTFGCGQALRPYCDPAYLSYRDLIWERTQEGKLVLGEWKLQTLDHEDLSNDTFPSLFDGDGNRINKSSRDELCLLAYLDYASEYDYAVPTTGAYHPNMFRRMIAALLIQKATRANPFFITSDASSVFLRKWEDALNGDKRPPSEDMQFWEAGVLTAMRAGKGDALLEALLRWFERRNPPSAGRNIREGIDLLSKVPLYIAVDSPPFRDERSRNGVMLPHYWKAVLPPLVLYNESLTTVDVLLPFTPREQWPVSLGRTAPALTADDSSLENFEALITTLFYNGDSANVDAS